MRPVELLALDEALTKTGDKWTLKLHKFSQRGKIP
jgi:hypothetical protein